MDRDSAVKWLSGGIGDPPQVLPDKLQKVLIAGFDAGHWTEKDVPPMGVLSSSSSKLWRAILKDSAAEASATISESFGVRFENWLIAITEGDAVDVASSKHVPSQRELDDLKAQGMTGLREILHLELAGFLGRASPESGIKGGTYGCTANEMDGAKLAFKQKRETVETVIASCRTAGNLRALDRFYGQLSTDLTRNEDPSIQKLSTRVLQFWQAANRNLMSRPEAVLTYVEEFRTDYRGRGIPVIYDAEIGGRSMWAAQSESNPGPSSGLVNIPLGGVRKPLAGEGMDTASTASGYSSIPSSSSDSSVRAIKDAQSEMQARQEAMASQLAELIKGVNSLSSSVSSMKAAKDREYYKDATCNLCGKKGHIARDCPDQKKESGK